MAYKIKQGDILHRVFILDLDERNLHILKEVWKVDKVEGGELFISKEFPDNRRKVRNTIREEYMSKLGYSVTKKGAATICVKETERLVAKYLTAIKKLKDEGKKK